MILYISCGLLIGQKWAVVKARGEIMEQDRKVTGLVSM